MYQYFIFDFDGTVVDTGEGILKSLQFAFEDNGRPVPDLSELTKFIGPPIHFSFVNYYDVPEEEVQTYIRSYRKRYREKGIYECHLYDGMPETLKELKRRGAKLGIASSKPEHLIFDVANHLGITELFDAVSGTLFDDSNHSGKADLILRAMEMLGATDKSEVLMIGDRLYDIDGAKDAGVDSCGVLFGYGSREEFIEHGADHIIAKAEELIDFISPQYV